VSGPHGSLARLGGAALVAQLSLALNLGLAPSAHAADPSLRPVRITAAEGELGALIVPVPALITNAGDDGGQIRVDNVSGLGEAFQISVQDYTLDANSKPVPAPSGFLYGSAAWYVFEATDFTLPPGTSRDVRFRLAVPPDAIPGDHFAALSVLVRAADPAAGGSGAHVESQLLFQIRLQHRIAGAEPREPRVTLEADPVGGAVDFTASVTNDGNTVLTQQFEPLPTLQLISTLPFADPTRPERTLKLDGFYVPPNSERLVRVSWLDPPLFGIYRAVLTLPAVDGVPAVRAETTFVVVHWPLLGLLAGLMLMIAVVVFAFRRRVPRGRLR
jgi:hypothetical protein